MIRINPISSNFSGRVGNQNVSSINGYGVKNGTFSKSDSVSFGAKPYELSFQEKAKIFERSTKGLNESMSKKILKLPNFQIAPFLKTKPDGSYLIPNTFLNGLDAQGIKFTTSKDDIKFKVKEITFKLNDGKKGIIITDKNENGDVVFFRTGNKKTGYENVVFENKPIQPAPAATSTPAPAKKSFLDKVSDFFYISGEDAMEMLDHDLQTSFGYPY